MTAKYFAILTNYGAAQLANAVALGTQMNISKMAVGDGGGTLPVPDPAQTKLVRETRRAAVNQVSVDEKNPNFIIAEQVIPENEGGWFIREIGLFDDNGGLIAVGNAPETYKPNLQEGSGRTQVIQMVLMVSSTQAITLKVDPSVVLATRDYVTKSIDAAIQASEARAAKTYQPIGDYVLHPYLKLELLKKVDKADIAQQLGNDTGKVVSQNLLTTELGKKAGVADVNSKLAKDQNGADIPDKQKFIDNLGLPGKFQPKDDYVLHSYLKLELLKKIDKADITHQLGNDTTKVVSQNLLTTELGKKAAVGTSYSKAESDGKYQPKGADLSELAIGINQKWANVSSQRSPGVNYTNGLKKPLMINIYAEMSGNNAPWIKLYVAGALVAHSHVRYDQNLKVAFVTAIVPPGNTYSYQKDGTTVVVMELR